MYFLIGRIVQFLPYSNVWDPQHFNLIFIGIYLMRAKDNYVLENEE